MLKQLLYRTLKLLVPMSFNTLNVLLAGNLPPLGSSCVIVEDQGRFLLIRRPGGGLVFPGGFIRWREHPAETARRECKEETGLEIHMLDTTGTYSTTSSRVDRMSTLTVVFAGEVIGGTLRGSVEGRPCWLDEADMLKSLEGRYTSMLQDYVAYRTRCKAQASMDTPPDVTAES